MKKLTELLLKNIKEKLAKFKNELIKKKKLIIRLKKILMITMVLKILDIYLMKKIFTTVLMIFKYLFNENEDYYEDKITHNESIIEDINKDTYYAEKIKKNEIKIIHMESPFKPIIEDIKRGLYYVEKMNNLSTSDIKNIKEKLTTFKNELFKNDNRIEKDLNEYKGIRDVRYLLNEYENQKSDFFETEKMKNKIVLEIKIKKDLNEYKGIKDIRYLFNDNIYKSIIDIRYFFNEYYCAKRLDIKSAFNKLSNNLVKVYTKDITERPINLEDIRDKFIAYSEYSTFGILSPQSYTDLKKIKVVSSVTFCDQYKILKTESRAMENSLTTLNMPLFLGFLRSPFIMRFNENALEEELSEYIELN